MHGTHTAGPDATRDGAFVAALRWSVRLLVVACWVGGIVFAAYIVAFFGGTLAGGAGERWNESLPGLFDAATPAAVAAIGMHFLAGSALLLLGPVQFIAPLRRRLPSLHRVLGRIYVASAALAGLGGLAFILVRGTVGGRVMDVGFGLYGALMVLCASMAFIHARARRIEAHRAWAIRLFALTIGSWLYRMEYGGWLLLTGGIGMGRGFSGWFDVVMVFFFYVPNLLVAEVVIRSRCAPHGARSRAAAAVLLATAGASVLLVTWIFARGQWGQRIASGLLQAVQ